VTLKRAVLSFAAVWVAAVTGLHLWLNPGLRSASGPGGARAAFRVGFLPVTCHLTCPVTDFIQRALTGAGPFEPIRFNGWPELKEAFLAGTMPATFLLAPLAISLREQGVALKIVYLGHRDGTAMMVHRDSGIFRIEDLRGKRIAVPNRFSNQHLLLYRAFRARGMSVRDVELVEMAPPDMPASLYARAVDAVTSGEPFMGQTELDGYGRVLYLTKDVWPDFISCVLAVHEGAIRDQRPAVQELVDGIARSGLWLEGGLPHRMQAARFVAEQYYHQHPRLLSFVLSKPPDRVKYSNLRLVRRDFEEIEALGREAGILAGTAHFDDYADPSFVPDEAGSAPWAFEAEPS